MSTATETQDHHSKVVAAPNLDSLEDLGSHETVIHHPEQAEGVQSPITRIVFIAVDQSFHSGFAFDWAVNNLLRPENDLVILANVRGVASVPGPYGKLYISAILHKKHGEPLVASLPSLPLTPLFGLVLLCFVLVPSCTKASLITKTIAEPFAHHYRNYYSYQQIYSSSSYSYASSYTTFASSHLDPDVTPGTSYMDFSDFITNLEEQVRERPRHMSMINRARTWFHAVGWAGRGGGERVPRVDYGSCAWDILYYMCKHRLNSHTLLQNYATKLKEKNIACKAIAMRGDARDEIVRKVQELNADVLIMGSRGLGALKRYIDLSLLFSFCMWSNGYRQRSTAGGRRS
ncbi:hypothetical protein BC936DRAFT_146808 [Jimgerdemannia flammicorona]|uniref:UspA domain-containing protein n=1 Tax=Jimgerdemannia flammicorona TaxID=994334 RepID=A0A433D6Q0_9FUNG|nr:hypothetical protein BC936DRAFT_146808 [Jimgerdemannia flammicorona]